MGKNGVPILKNYCGEMKDAVKEATIEMKLDSQRQSEHLNALEESEIWGDKVRKIMITLSGKLGNRKNKKNNHFTNEELQPIINKVFGKDADKASWLLHITTALNRREDLADLFDELASNLILQYSMARGENVENYISRLKDDGGMVPNLQELPVGLLAQIGGMLAAMMSVGENSDLNVSTGWFGNLQLEFITPLRLATKTADMPFYKFIKRMTFYNQKVEQETRRFTRKRPDIRILEKDEEKFPGGRIIFNRRDFGLVELLNTAAGQLMQQPLADIFGDKEDMLELVSMMLRGQVFMDTDGKVWAYSREAKVQGKFYPGTNDPIYGFFDKVPYMMNEDGQFIGFEKPGISDKQLQFNNKKITKGQPGAANWFGMNQMTIFLNYMQSIKGVLNQSGLHFASSYNEIVAQKDDLRKQISLLPKEQQEAIMPHLEMLDNEFIQVHGLTEFQLVNTDKKPYFPRLYYAGDRVKAIRAAQIEWTKRVKDAATLYEAEEDPGKKISRYKDLIESNRNLLLLNQKLEILANPHILRDTSQSDNPIFADNYAKHFREVTHLIPINVARTDEFVIQDYISENIKTIERMKVVLELANLALQNTNKPRTIKYAVNLFKRTFGFPDAEGSIAGVRFTDEFMAKALQRIGIRTSPESTNRAFRTLNSVNVGNLLMNPTDGPQNFSSTLQDVLNSGTEEFNFAAQMYRKHRQYWLEKAENAGITVYIKYLEGFVDKAFRASELESYKKAKKHIKAALKKIDNMPLNTSRKELRRQYKNDMRVLKREFPNAVNRFAREIGNYAIQRRVEIRKADSKLKSKGKWLLNAYGIIPSIESTETDLRVISYIIAYNKIKKLLKHQAYTSKQIDELARNYVFFTQFGLETQHVGDMYGTTLGKWWGSLAVWRNQKMGFSIDTQRQLIRSYFKPYKLFEGGKGKKAAMKTNAAIRAYAEAALNILHLPWHGASYGKRAEAYRRLAPGIRKGQGHFMIHGLATAFFTFVIFTNPWWISSTVLLAARRIVQTGGAHKMGYGLNDPLYSLILASGALVASVAMGDEDEEDKELWLTSKVLRNLVGVGGTDMFLTLVAINRAYETYLTGEPQDDSYYQNPAAQHSYSHGLYGEAGKLAKKGAEESSALFGDWNYERKEQKRAGKVHRYYNPRQTHP